MSYQEQPAAGLKLPLLNERAPDFEAMSTSGVVRLSDYEGRWVVLFAHPADFTPVCTSELIALSKGYKRFKSMHAELVGLSVDSRFSHIAWLRAIKERFGVEIPFPIVEDQNMIVARRYGMIHPSACDTATVRATFFIDDKGILRAMIYYPMTVGRSIDEILRVLQALQEVDHANVALPAGWRPGDPAIVPPPETVAEAERRSASGDGVTDWYYATRSLPKRKH